MVYLIIAVSILVIDQTTKAWVRKKIKADQEIEVIKDRFYVTNVTNTGAAYGFLKNYPKLLTVVTAYSLFKISDIFINLIKTNKDNKAYKFAFACVMGGAIGNVADRLYRKYVTDFIFIKSKRIKNPPIFNMADFFIMAGAVVFIVKTIRLHKLK